MQNAFIDEAVQQALNLHKQGSPRHKALAGLIAAAETVAGGDAVASILVLDKEGLLRNGASPRLPPDYLNAIDGLKPDPHVGTCAAAAATGKMILTPDFHADDKWAELRHLPLALGFVGAWSLPIKNDHGKVLGTFGTYFRENRHPTDTEINSIKTLALAASTILEEVPG